MCESVCESMWCVSVYVNVYACVRVVYECVSVSVWCE